MGRKQECRKGLNVHYIYVYVCVYRHRYIDIEIDKQRECVNKGMYN